MDLISGAATQLLQTSKTPIVLSDVLIPNIKIRKTAAVLVATVCQFSMQPLTDVRSLVSSLSCHRVSRTEKFCL
jgi:hypothetical protein